MLRCFDPESVYYSLLPWQCELIDNAFNSVSPSNFRITMDQGMMPIYSLKSWSKDQWFLKLPVQNLRWIYHFCRHSIWYKRWTIHKFHNTTIYSARLFPTCETTWKTWFLMLIIIHRWHQTQNIRAVVNLHHVRIRANQSS